MRNAIFYLRKSLNYFKSFNLITLLICLYCSCLPSRINAQEFVNPNFEESYNPSCDECDEDLSCVLGWWSYIPLNPTLWLGNRALFNINCSENESATCQGNFGLEFYKNQIDPPIADGSAIATRNPFYGTPTKEEEYIIKFNGYYKDLHIEAEPPFLQISGSESQFSTIALTTWLAESKNKIASPECTNYDVFLGRNGRAKLLYEENLDEFPYLIFMYNTGSAPAFADLSERTDPPLVPADYNIVIDELSICKPVNVTLEQNCDNSNVCFKFDFDPVCYEFPVGKTDDGDFSVRMVLIVDEVEQFVYEEFEDTEFCLEELEPGEHTYEFQLTAYMNESDYWTLQGPGDPDDYFSGSFAGSFNVSGGAGTNITVNTNTIWATNSVPNGGIVKKCDY